MKLAAEVNRHMIHIHTTAPGPPRKIAPATPEILPVPTRAAAEIVNAWNEDNDLRRSGAASSFCVFSVMERNISGIIRSWIAPVRIVKYSATMATMPAPIQVQSHSSAPLSQELRFSIMSIDQAY